MIGRRGAYIQLSVTPVEGIGERKPVFFMEQEGSFIFRIQSIRILMGRYFLPVLEVIPQKPVSRL